MSCLNLGSLLHQLDLQLLEEVAPSTSVFGVSAALSPNFPFFTSFSKVELETCSSAETFFFLAVSLLDLLLACSFSKAALAFPRPLSSKFPASQQPS